MPYAEDYPYATYLNEYYGALELVDVPALVAACTHPWYNQTLCRVNESVVRLGVMRGEYHWHKHDDEDEFFYVIEGSFSLTSKAGRWSWRHARDSWCRRGSCIARELPERAVILMVEGAGIVPTGDS